MDSGPLISGSRYGDIAGLRSVISLGGTPIGHRIIVGCVWGLILNSEVESGWIVMLVMETYGIPREGYIGYMEGGYGRSTRRTVLGLPGVVSPQFSEEEFYWFRLQYKGQLGGHCGKGVRTCK